MAGSEDSPPVVVCDAGPLIHLDLSGESPVGGAAAAAAKQIASRMNDGGSEGGD